MLIFDPIGFTAGSWDLLHAGHVGFLSKCLVNCDTLIVGLHVNPSIERPHKNKPIQSTTERYLQLSAIQGITTIIPYETESDLTNIIAIMDIDKYFIGGDHEGETPTGFDICEKRKIEIIYIPRLHNYSSSDLRTRICTAKTFSTK